MQCAMDAKGTHPPPFETKPSGHDRHRVASHETHVERVTARAALFVMQNVPASHAVQTVAVPVASGARPIDGARPRITPQADALHLRLTEDPADATRVPLSGKKQVMRRTTPVECSAVVLCRAVGRVGADKAVVAHVAPDSRCEAAVVALTTHTVKDNARPARKTSFRIASRAQRAKRLRAPDTRACRKTEPIGARDDAPSVATSALSGTVHARPCLSTPRRRRTLPCRGTPRSGRRHRGHTPSLRVSHRWRTSGRG